MLYIFYTEKKRLRDKWYAQGTNLDLGPEEAAAQKEKQEQSCCGPWCPPFCTLLPWTKLGKLWKSPTASFSSLGNFKLARPFSLLPNCLSTASLILIDQNNWLSSSNTSLHPHNTKNVSDFSPYCYPAPRFKLEIFSSRPWTISLKHHKNIKRHDSSYLKKKKINQTAKQIYSHSL